MIDLFLGEPDPRDRYEHFNQWCKEEGVLMPKMEYPAIFENGLIGARVTEEIQHREAYLFVPYKMLMSIEKAQMHPVLGPIIMDHPECFLEEENNDWEQLILALFIFYEMTKGRDSYWYPYLRMMPDVVLTSSWSDQDIAVSQDSDLDKAL